MKYTFYYNSSKLKSMKTFIITNYYFLLVSIRNNPNKLNHLERKICTYS